MADDACCAVQPGTCTGQGIYSCAFVHHVYILYCFSLPTSSRRRLYFPFLTLQCANALLRRLSLVFQARPSPKSSTSSMISKRQEQACICMSWSLRVCLSMPMCALVRLSSCVNAPRHAHDTISVQECKASPCCSWKMSSPRMAATSTRQQTLNTMPIRIR